MAGGTRLREGLMQTTEGKRSPTTPGTPATKQFHTPHPSGTGKRQDTSARGKLPSERMS